MGHRLWRQDDNGNRVLIATHATRAEADAACAALEARAHKQLYWVDSDDPPTPDPITDRGPD